MTQWSCLKDSTGVMAASRGGDWCDGWSAILCRDGPGGSGRRSKGLGQHRAPRLADGASLVTSAVERNFMTPERYQRIGQLFDAALERRAEERSAYLDHACGADADLR